MVKIAVQAKQVTENVLREHLVQQWQCFYDQFGDAAQQVKLSVEEKLVAWKESKEKPHKNLEDFLVEAVASVTNKEKDSYALPELTLYKYFVTDEWKKDSDGLLSLSRCDFRGVGHLLFGVDFRGCNVTYAKFQGVMLDFSKWAVASLNYADFSESSLYGAMIGEVLPALADDSSDNKSCIVTGASFHRADLRYTQWNHSSADYVDFSHADFSYACWNNACSFSFARLNGTIVTEGSFCGVEEAYHPMTLADIDRCIGLSEEATRVLQERKTAYSKGITSNLTKEKFFAYTQFYQDGAIKVTTEDSQYHFYGEKAGFFFVIHSRNGHPPWETNGHKFHISIDKDTVPCALVQAWGAILPVILNEENGVGEVKIVDQYQVEGSIFEVQKQITLYAFSHTHTGKMDKTAAEWEKLLHDIAEKLKSAGIKPAAIPPEDYAVRGNPYASYRYDHDKEGNYVSARTVVKKEKIPADHPFISILVNVQDRNIPEEKKAEKIRVGKFFVSPPGKSPLSRVWRVDSLDTSLAGPSSEPRPGSPIPRAGSPLLRRNKLARTHSLKELYDRHSPQFVTESCTPGIFSRKRHEYNVLYSEKGCFL